MVRELLRCGQVLDSPKLLGVFFECGVKEVIFGLVIWMGGSVGTFELDMFIIMVS